MMSANQDPFKKDREDSGVHTARVDGETIPLILTLREIRKTAKDWQTFSSDNPLMCVLHSEAHVRTVRQLPLEIDPPAHTEYRSIVEPIFKRPKSDPAYAVAIERIINQALDQWFQANESEAVRGLALPIQCHALAVLLQMPEAAAHEWISWGVHVFHDRDDGNDAGPVLKAYTQKQFERAKEEPGNDFFSILNEAEIQGRKLSMEEKQGYANVTFAGGRDTIINTLSSIVAYVAEYPESLHFLREDEQHLITATEEFVRYVSPLTAITRKCPHSTALHDQTVAAGGRIGLCWPSANRDEDVFDQPDKVILNRKPNPHVGFGFGPHNCLGAPHARLVIRSFLKQLCNRIETMQLIEATPKVEQEETFSRMSGYESVTVRVTPR
tara:strand:- start:1763 stop:2911 length:1149 start_codon:yes stop_codon:yes gene_type:complete